MKSMGGLSSLMDKMPAQMQAKAGQVDMNKAERDIKRKEGIIQSMTPLERRKPELIKATRKRRIAAGAGVQVQEVNRLLNEFEQMQGMMKKMKGGGLMKMMKRMGGMKGAFLPQMTVNQAQAAHFFEASGWICGQHLAAQRVRPRPR
jgi:signal recognition particle subunit SRP54